MPQSGDGVCAESSQSQLTGRSLGLDNAVIKITEVSRNFDRPPKSPSKGIGAKAVTDVSFSGTALWHVGP